MAAPAIALTNATADDLAFAPSTPLKEQAWALYCQGAHSPEIGRTLGVPERTIRHWLNRTLKDLDAEHTALRAHELALAIARKRQLSVAAWESYSRLSAIADAECAKAADGDPTANFRLVRQALSTGARYLALANAIDRDLVRLSGGSAHLSSSRTPAPTPSHVSNPDHHDETPDPDTDTAPSLDATLLDLLTPDIIARMAKDGILDDWPPSPASDADQTAPETGRENAIAAKTANAANAADETLDARTPPTSPAPTRPATQNENAAISANHIPHDPEEARETTATAQRLGYSQGIRLGSWRTVQCRVIVRGGGLCGR